MIFNVGISYPNCLANLTIGVGGHTLWLTIIASNWKSIKYEKKWGDYFGCFSVFTFAYTRKEG
jgi:hypothetical protein